VQLTRPAAAVIHGQTVSDPYQWLEDRDSAATTAWISKQQARSAIYFTGTPELTGIRDRVSSYLNIETYDQFARVGSRLFYRRRKQDEEQPCIYTTGGADVQGHVLVDPSLYGPCASIAIHRISDDGSLLAFELKYTGSDATAIHLVDTVRGALLSDHLSNGYARGFEFSPRNDGFYYCHEDSPSSAEHTIRFHLLGEASDDDVVLFRMRRTLESRLVLIADHIHVGAICTHRHGVSRSTSFYIARHGDQSRWTLLVADKPGLFAPILKQGRIFAMTEEGAPNRRIIEVAKNGTEHCVVVPAGKALIQNFIVIGDTFYCSYLVDGTMRIHSWTLDGGDTGSVGSPAPGSVQILPRLSGGSSSFFVSCESFIHPSSTAEFCPGKQRFVSCTAAPFHVDSARYCVRALWYPSKDGTTIPMSLARRADLDPAAPHPAIMTSYGGFGVPMTQKFSALVMVLLELGVVFALPGIRGGSEFGKAWHEAARGRNRQIAFDDFIAAAEWLVREGITTPQKLGIFGGSNAGLLVGASMTQRPDLFRAVLCIAPLLDMLRYEHFDRARNWRGEYGTVSDPTDFAALYAYSPYHHIGNDINYPATLFVSGDSDDRCNPAHVRKMAARLQDRGAQTEPILVDYSPERGHSPVLPLSTRIDALTRRIAFFTRELGIAIPGEDIQ
jgi:prolyl oligopeptidase